MRSSPDQLWAVVLAGGIGSRFWPASTPHRPKQLLPLVTHEPLIRETIERIEPLVSLERIRVLTGERLAVAIRQLMPELTDRNFFIEPRAAGTAPILAWAAAEIERVDPDAIMLSVHADHVIAPASVFREQVAAAAELAATHGRLFTLGAVPTRAETGYGYIHLGSHLSGADKGDLGSAFEVDRFVEKPNRETAEAYLADEGYLWNTGLFVWKVRDLLDQLERHTPEIGPAIPELRAGDHKGFFDRVPTLSIDEGLLERSDRVAVLPARFQWDDIGAWDALFRTRTLDGAGNALVGDAHAVETFDSAIYAEGGPVVAFGVQDLVIERAAGVTFVTRRDLTADLKRLLERLPQRLLEPNTTVAEGGLREVESVHPVSKPRS